MNDRTERVGRRTLLLLGVLCISACASTGPARAQAPVMCELEGMWQPPEANAGGLIAITHEAGVWSGHVMLDGEPRHQILKELEYDAENGEYEGRLDSPDGPEVSATVVCVSENEIEVTGRRFGMSRSFRWTRHEAPEGAAPVEGES
ncbi:MAG: hypothetical protein AAF389_05110 [Gemmatimonadota bacterium]